MVCYCCYLIDKQQEAIRKSDNVKVIIRGWHTLGGSPFIGHQVILKTFCCNLTLFCTSTKSKQGSLIWLARHFVDHVTILIITKIMTLIFNSLKIGCHLFELFFWRDDSCELSRSYCLPSAIEGGKTMGEIRVKEVLVLTIILNMWAVMRRYWAVHCGVSVYQQFAGNVCDQVDYWGLSMW